MRRIIGSAALLTLSYSNIVTAQSLDQAPSISASSVATTVPATSAVAPAELRSINDPTRIWALRLHAELGFVAIASHRIQFSQNNTYFDYVSEGGQDTLLPFARFSAELELARRHTIVLLYQPLDVRTAAAPSTDVSVDNVTFRAGRPLELRYGFDFYRVSYLYDLIAAPEHELSVGLSMQIRNANIEFTATDGSARVSNHNVGIVPILKARGRYGFRNGAFLGFEIDGFWASGRIITGSTNDFEGAICDASLRAGLHLFGPTEAFINLRYLGGGSRGRNESSTGPGDGYNNNWLHTVALSLGATLR